MARNLFTDPNAPASLAPPRNPYPWPVNHSEEDGYGRTRALTILQPTAAAWKPVKPIRQQGAGSPRVLQLRGSIFDEDQHRTFLRFLALCTTQTVHFTHCEGGKFEVLLTRYEPTRQRVVKTPRGGTRLWRYALEMEVIAQLA